MESYVYVEMHVLIALHSPRTGRSSRSGVSISFRGHRRLPISIFRRTCDAFQSEDETWSNTGIPFASDKISCLHWTHISLLWYVFLDSFLPFGGGQFKSECTVTEQREFLLRKLRWSKRCGNVSAASHFALHWDLLALLGGSLSWIYAAWQTCSVQWTDECDSWNTRSTRWPQKWKSKPERTRAHLHGEKRKMTHQLGNPPNPHLCSVGHWPFFACHAEFVQRSCLRKRIEKDSNSCNFCLWLLIRRWRHFFVQQGKWWLKWCRFHEVVLLGGLTLAAGAALTSSVSKEGFWASDGTNIFCGL